MNGTDLMLVIVTIAVSFLFSGLEISFVSASRLRIELKAKQGDRTGMMLSEFVKKTPRVITTILVGNNVALVIYGISIAALLDPPIKAVLGIDASDPVAAERYQYQVLVLQTLVSTIIILVFGEYLPKAIFRLNPDRMLFRLAGVLQAFYYLVSPLAMFISWLSGFFLRTVFRMKYEDEKVVFSKEDLNLYMQHTLARMENNAEAPEIDTEMFSNAMEFNETRVREFMIPRTEIQAVSLDTGMEALRDKFIETELSRLVIYKDSLDNVVGFVHSSALFRRPRTIQEVLQPVLMVPETMAANVLLSEFNRNRKTMAIVVDEHGGTEGLVTLEDLVEVVFGDIQDEYDAAEADALVEKQVDEGVWEFSARLYVDDLNKDHNLHLPVGEYNTLSGLILHHSESIPAKGEVLELENCRITILEAAENRIELVRIERVAPESGM